MSVKKQADASTSPSCITEPEVASVLSFQRSANENAATTDIFVSTVRPSSDIIHDDDFKLDLGPPLVLMILQNVMLQVGKLSLRRRDLGAQ